MYTVCRRCGRKLKSEASQHRGYGSYCYSLIAKDEKRDIDDSKKNIDNPKREEIEGQLDLLKREAI